MATPAPTPAETQHNPVMCDRALSHVFEVLGKRWNGVILGTLMNGGAGFADLRRGVNGISDSMLSDRLAELARLGLVRRSVVEGPPVSVTYELTDSGRAMMPALNALTEWARENFRPPAEPSC